jgi:hypothetical protein
LSPAITVSFTVLQIILLAAQIIFRSVLLPVTEALDLEYWEACIHPGGYR